jgi:PAS domain S-box-containing protein
MPTTIETLQSEIQRYRRIEEELNLLLATTRAISEAADSDEALKTVLEKICVATGWDIGEAWLPARDGEILRRAHAWHRVDPDLEAFSRWSETVTYDRGVGLMGRVWTSGRTQWISNIAVRPAGAFVRGKAAVQRGLKAVLALPVVSEDEVLAVLAFFLRAVREEDRRTVDIVTAVVGQLGPVLRCKQVEKALLEHERRLHAIFNQTSLFVGLLTPEGIVLEANETALRFRKIGLADVKGRPFWETPWWDISTETQDRLKAAIAEAARGHFVRYEVDLRGAGGEVATFDFSLKPINDDAGRAILIIPEGRDITERKRMELELREAKAGLDSLVEERTRELTRANEKLRLEAAERRRIIEELSKSEERYRAMIETTQDAVVSIDRHGRVVLFNNAAERIFGYARLEIQGKKVNLLMAEPYATEHDGYIKRYEETGEQRAIGRIRTVEARRKNGEIFPIELSVAEIATGEEVRYTAFIRDISEKTRLQEKLVENNRLAAVGATAARLAHEIGNPLNGMLMATQLLERRLAVPEERDNPAIRSTLRGLKDEMRRLSHLLDDFRSFSRQEKYRLTPIALAAVADELCALEASSYAAAGIRVEQFFPTDLPLVLADRDKLKQALLNLCKNATEAMPDGGTLTLRAHADGKEVILEVADTGAGIPPELNIFEPFTTTKPSGTGLGLMIARQIVAAHSGRLSYTSELGKGTIFYVDLPQAPI